MSDDSLSTAKRLYASFARGDLAAVLDSLDPDVEWVTPTTLPWSRGAYRGREGVAAYLGSFNEALADGRVEPEEFLAAGDQIVALGHERATVRATGRAFEAPFAHVLTVRDGRVAGLRGHVDTATIQAAFE